MDQHPALMMETMIEAAYLVHDSQEEDIASVEKVPGRQGTYWVSMVSVPITGDESQEMPPLVVNSTLHPPTQKSSLSICMEICQM